MKKNIFIYIAIFLLAFCIAGCKGSKDTPEPPQPPGPQPPNPPQPEEQEVGKIFFHDNGPQSRYDIYMADLFIVPIETGTNAAVPPPTGKLVRLTPGNQTFLHAGVKKFRHIEFKGKVIERAVINTFNSVDITKYNFEVRNVENLTNSASDDFAVNVNSNNWITFVCAPDTLAVNSQNTEIYYMDVNDRVRHRLTPINNQYSGQNFDPDWKTDDTIIWSHRGEFVEVNINDLNVSDSILPDISGAIYDPKYSPDGTRIIYNTKISRKKNSFYKDLVANTTHTVLPDAYFNAYEDDNPTWVFSNSLIVGHLFIDGKGRLYTRNLDTGDFLIITDESRDSRYVTPFNLDGDTYFLFSDWTDPNNISLWIVNHNGTIIRDLSQTGGEVVFRVLGMPVPETREEMHQIALDYAGQFD